MPLLLGSSRKRYQLTWQQRAAGVCFALFIIIHAPTFNFQVEYSDDTVRLQPWSPLQVVCVGLLKTNPEWHTWVKYLLVPGTLFETLALTIDECYVNPSQFTPCDWGKLKDWQRVLERADYRDKVEVFSEKMGEYRQFVQAAAAAATVFSFSSAILDGTVGLLGGYTGLAYLVSKAGCNVVAVTNMSVATMITVYVIMARGNKPRQAAVSEPVGASAQPTVAASSTPSKAPLSPKKMKKK